MARTIAIDVPHTLGIAEARRRAAEGLAGLARRLPGGAEVTTRWSSENEVALDILAMGRRIPVEATIEEALIQIRLALPLIFAVIAGSITSKVHDAVAAMLRGPATPPVVAPSRPAPADRPLILFQYWDQSHPPPDVAAWIEGFRADNPGLQHILFSAGKAERYVAKHHGERGRAAFRACGHPAMQADYFRLCAMATHGGIYLDADMQSRLPLDSLLAIVPEALVATWKGLLNNSILIFRDRHHSFVEACLALATQVIEDRLFHSIALATGPGIFNAIRYLADPDFRATMSDMLDHGGEDVSRLIGDTSDPDLAAKVGSTLDRAGWDDLRTLARMADALAPRFPTLAEDYAAMTIVGTAHTLAWIGQEPADYQKAGDSWLFGDRRIYR
jgi:hypothetical protein